MRPTLPLLLATVLWLPASAFGEGLPIQKGEWKVTSQMSVSVAPRPRERESVGCFAEDTVTADELTGRSGMCDNEEIQVSGNTMTWKVSCRGPMAGNTGEGRVTMEDASFEGEMKLRGRPRPDGERVVVTTTWQGERLGDCKPPPSDATEVAP